MESIKQDIITTLTKKELYYYKMVNRYYKSCDKSLIDKMLQIINGESNISLRILDWFVTRYASKYKICFGTVIDDSLFNVHISYKAQLKSYKKRYFDPFRRRKKFYYNYDCTDKTKTFLTTIGQLNFFYWALSNNIIDYVEKNIDQITKIMVQMNKETRIKKQLLNNPDKINKIINNQYINMNKMTEKKIILYFD